MTKKMCVEEAAAAVIIFASGAYSIDIISATQSSRAARRVVHRTLILALDLLAKCALFSIPQDQKKPRHARPCCWGTSEGPSQRARLQRRVSRDRIRLGGGDCSDCVDEADEDRVRWRWDFVDKVSAPQKQSLTAP